MIFIGSFMEQYGSFVEKRALHGLLDLPEDDYNWYGSLMEKYGSFMQKLAAGTAVCTLDLPGDD